MNASLARAHWFFLAGPLVVATDVLVALQARGQFDRVLEAGLLFDLAVIVPALYWLCYRDRGRRSAIRAAALACLGIWATLKLVPAAEQDLVTYVAPLRYVGLAVLVWLEFAVVLAIYRSVFGGRSTSEAVAAASRDLPPWQARIIALEAAFWRKVWSLLKRLFRAR